MIVVTAPTGNIGRHVVAHLIAGKANIRLIVRDAGKLSDDVRDKVEVIEGSHSEASVVNRAFEGADALFWLVPPDVTQTLDKAYLDFTRPAVEAIRRHAVARIVSVTALGRGTRWQNRAGLVTASIQMQDMLMASGAALRGLALPSFMDNILRQAGTIRTTGSFFGTIDPDMQAPTTATRDAGACAARLLAYESWVGQEELPVVGPEELSPSDMAATISEILGREVRYQQTTLEAFGEQLLTQGVTPSFAEGYVMMMAAKGAGMDNVPEHPLPWRTPTTFRQWCQEELKPALVG